MRCVPAHHFTVAKARTWRSSMDEHPPYQRESAVWSLDKQQLFIDSLLNGYDVPKIYLHDLRGRHPTKVYALVDGKQRLTTIWGYLDDAFPLAADFRIAPGHFPDLPRDAVAPVGPLRFSEIDPHWQRVLTRTYLSVVLIRDASEENIEDLFSRLNNGEALNAAERRNAMGGDMVRLIRDVARRPFFTESLAFSNARQQQYDLAARLLVLEWETRSDPGGLPDIRSEAVDAFVREHRQMADADRAMLIASIGARLEVLGRMFSPADPRLSSPGQVLLHYLFARSALGSRPSEVEVSRVRAFIDSFHSTVTTELDRPGEALDGAAVERRLDLLLAAYATVAQPEPSGRWETRR